MWAGLELVVDGHAELAEGPLWDERTGSLYWVDLLAGTVHRTRAATGVDETLARLGSVGAIGLCEDGSLVTATERGFGFLDVVSGAHRLVTPVEEDDPATRMNDGKVDPAGRFWAGTMRRDEREGAGTLYRLEAGGRVVPVLGGVTISNGLDWSADLQSMYYIDTPTRRVDLFAYDHSTGAISDRRAFVTIPSKEGWPDGLALDAEGCLWVALFDGWAVQRYTPDGRLDRRIELPVQQATSVAFGGDDLDELYITTGQEGFPPGGDPSQPHAGGVFRCRPGVSGRPVNRFASPPPDPVL